MNAPPPCRTVSIYAFRGDRGELGKSIRAALAQAENGNGDGPSAVECLLYAGHAGISIDSGIAIFGFNPEFGDLPLWQGMQRLRNGDAFPGDVRDDTEVFERASLAKLTPKIFDIILPEPAFRAFEETLAAERRSSRYKYGFPNGDGDCNCITWLERLALPLLSGSMGEFMRLAGWGLYSTRRFGSCR